MMRTRFFAAVLLALLSPCVGAAERWQLLVIGQQTEGLAADHPAYRTVEQAIISELKARDIDAYHQSVVGVSLGCDTTVCPGLSERDLVTAARQAAQPIDMLVLYSLRTVPRSDPAGLKVAVEVAATLINLENGDHFYTWDRPLGDFRLAEGQPGEARYDAWLSARARDASANAAVALTEALAQQTRRYVFWLDFERLPQARVEALTQEIRAMGGAVSGGLTLLSEGNPERQWLHRLTNVSYSLRSELDGAELRVIIGELVDRIGVSADVTYDRESRRLAVRLVGIAFLPYYIATVVGALLLIYVLYLQTQRQRTERALERAEAGCFAEQGLSVLANVPPTVLWRRSWHARATRWQQAVDDAQSQCEQAAQALEGSEYATALEHAEAALAANADSTQAPALIERARSALQAVALMTQAEACWQTNPAECLRLIERARALSPEAAAQVGVLATRADRALRANLMDRSEAEAERAMAAGHHYAALAAYDRILSATRGLADFVADRARIEQARAAIAAEMPAIRSSCSGQAALEGVELLRESQIPIGRSKVPVAGAIALSFGRLSRLGKQACLHRSGDGFVLEHVDSSNGLWLADHPVKPHTRVSLGDEAVIAMGGETSPAQKGICQLAFRVPASGSGSAVVALDATPMTLISNQSLLATWPSLEADMTKRWVMLGERLLCRVADDQTVQLGVSHEQADFELGFEHGVLTIGPVEGADAELLINNMACEARVPLVAGAQVAVAGVQLGFAPHVDEMEQTL